MQEQAQEDGLDYPSLIGTPGDPARNENTVRFVARSVKKFIKGLPDPVLQMIAFALYLAKQKRKHPKASPMNGFPGTEVVEVRKPHSGDTFCVVYAVGVPQDGTILVLDAFKKKSHHGSELPKVDKKRIEARLSAARLREPEDFDLW